MRIILPLALLIACVMPTTDRAMLATGTVSGTVMDSNGKIIPNHRVIIRKVVARGPVGRTTLAAESLAAANVTTDKEGKFSQSLNPGPYWAEAGSKTLGHAKERFDVKEGETTEVKLTLKKDEK